MKRFQDASLALDGRLELGLPREDQPEAGLVEEPVEAVPLLEGQLEQPAPERMVMVPENMVNHLRTGSVEVRLVVAAACQLAALTA